MNKAPSLPIGKFLILGIETKGEVIAELDARLTPPSFKLIKGDELPIDQFSSDLLSARPPGIWSLGV